MDRIFEAQETAAYEQWLESRSGGLYQKASTGLLDRILDCRRGWRVLDIGCGLGFHLSHLMERGILAHGVDSGPVMARLASQRMGEKVEIRVGDAHDLPYDDNSFDAVILVNSLELMDRRAQVLAEAVRVAVSRICIISSNLFSLSGLGWRLPGPSHPLFKGAPLPLWSLWRLVREVLGPVPKTWAGASMWPGGGIGHRPFAGLVGVCAAVTPRYMTRPLVIETTGRPRAATPAHLHGQVSHLRRLK